MRLGYARHMGLRWNLHWHLVRYNPRNWYWGHVVTVYGNRRQTTAGPMAGSFTGNGGSSAPLHQHAACFAANTFGDDLWAVVPVATLRSVVRQATPYVGRWAKVRRAMPWHYNRVCNVCNATLFGPNSAL